MPAVLHRLGAGNVEPGYSALYCRFDLLARPQVDRRRPLGGPDIGYHIEMTRLNIPVAFRVSLLESENSAGSAMTGWRSRERLAAPVAETHDVTFSRSRSHWP
jgi:hypothetical protein